MKPSLNPTIVAEAESRLVCPECGGGMKLKPSRFGQFYGCASWSKTGCKGGHGAHPNGAPLGTPGNAETKAARGRAHAAFDRLWQEGHMKRRSAYGWLAYQFGVTTVHIGESDIATCERIVTVVEAWFAERAKEATNGTAT